MRHDDEDEGGFLMMRREERRSEREHGVQYEAPAPVYNHLARASGVGWEQARAREEEVEQECEEARRHAAAQAARKAEEKEERERQQAAQACAEEARRVENAAQARELLRRVEEAARLAVPGIVEAARSERIAGRLHVERSGAVLSAVGKVVGQILMRGLGQTPVGPLAAHAAGGVGAGETVDVLGRNIDGVLTRLGQCLEDRIRPFRGRLEIELPAPAELAEAMSRAGLDAIAAEAKGSSVSRPGSQGKAAMETAGPLTRRLAYVDAETLATPQLAETWDRLVPKIVRRPGMAGLGAAQARGVLAEARALLFDENGGLRAEGLRESERALGALRLFVLEPRTPTYQHLETLAEGFGLWAEHVGKRMQTAASSNADAVQGAGRGVQGLPESVRAPLEERLGSSLAEVRVHVDSPRAGGTTQAFTEGKDIHVAAGRFAPDTQEGFELLAHEAAHTLQQAGQGEPLPGGIDGAQARALLEQDAELAAQAAGRGERAKVRLSSAPGMVQRLDSFEHLEVIDAGASDRAGRARGLRLKVSGLWVTAGEVGALMKDFFGAFESLDQCPRERLEPLVAAIRKQQEQARDNGGRPTAEQAAENEERFQRLTLYREETAYDPQSRRLRPQGELEGGEAKSYFTRARENSEHFFGLNLETGFAEIGQGLNLLARAAGLRGEARSELQRQAEGHLYASFHLFTDALSAGHMVDGEKMRNAGQEFWGQHKVEIVAYLSTALLRKYPWASRLTDPTSLHRLIQHELLSFLPDKIASLLLKLEHDRLGQSGLWLANRRGHIWLGLGDDGLARSAGIQLIGPLLVAEVIERFERFRAASDAGQNPSITRAMMEIEQGILDLLPSQVEQGGHYVPLADLAEDKSRFLASIQEQVMQDDPEQNKLLQLMLHHSTLLWQQLEEKVMKVLAESDAHERQYRDLHPDSDPWKRQIR